MTTNGDLVGPRRGVGKPFRPGNPGGPGNPFARQVNTLRSKLYEAVTPEDFAQVVTALVDGAKAGKLPFVRELLDRLIGKPPQAVHVSGAETGDEDGPGVSVVDLQIVIVQALKDMPEARQRVAQALRELHEQHRATEDGARS
jgi:hypothetical protein